MLTGFGGCKVFFMTIMSYNSELLYSKTSSNRGRQMGCRHSSVDLSAPSILPPWVRNPSNPSKHLFHLQSNLCFNCHCVVKRTKINKKRPGFAHFKKNIGRQIATIEPWFCLCLRYSRPAFGFQARQQRSIHDFHSLHLLLDREI